VKQGGGQIFVHSEVEIGTTFKIYFPRVDAALQNEAEKAPGAFCCASETILLVEDEDTVRESIAEYLQQLATPSSRQTVDRRLWRWRPSRRIPLLLCSPM
jgi:hypothetical protein